MKLPLNHPCWRALHSYAIDTILRQPHPDNASAIIDRTGGATFRNFAESIGTGFVKVALFDVNGMSHYRIMVWTDDEKWSGLTHPPAMLLGLADEECDEDLFTVDVDGLRRLARYDGAWGKPDVIAMMNALTNGPPENLSTLDTDSPPDPAA
jgi:hypothetical protein